MKQEIPQNVMKAWVQLLLEEGEQSNPPNPPEAALTTLTATINDHVSDMPQAMHDRLLQLAQIHRDFMAACRDFDRAHAAEESHGRAASLAEMDRLRKNAKAISDVLHFPYAAEILSKTESFDEFCALLPYVDLGQTYGSGHGKVSAFPLIWALSARDRPLERVQRMLAAGARVDLEKWRNTVLHEMAAMKRKAAIRLPILRLLVFKGADLEAETLHGQTPLNIAIEVGTVESVEHFLIVGSKVRTADFKSAASDPEKLAALLNHFAGDTAHLREAAQIAGWLRGQIKDWEQQQKEALQAGAKGPFHALVLDKLRRSLALLAELPGYSSGEMARKVTWQEEPAAFFSVRDAKTLTEYRQALARVDIKTFHMGGDHPIYWPITAKEDRCERLWSMLSAGASVSGGANGTALHIFASHRRKNADEQFRMAQMLVQAGADLEARNYSGLTPFACAVESRGYVEAAALLRLGAKPNVTLSSRRLFGDRYDAPILFAAADDFRIFKAMLTMAVDVTVTDDSKTPLRDFIGQEISRLSRMLEQEKDLSGSIRLRIEQSLSNFSKSLKLLDSMKRKVPKAG